MTLDEAIKHAEEVAEENEKQAEALADFDGGVKLQCHECAKEHRQLAEWLRAYKTMDYNIRHLIDRYAEEIKKLEQDVEDEPMGKAAVNRNTTLGYYYRFIGELRGVLDMEDGEL